MVEIVNVFGWIMLALHVTVCGSYVRYTAWMPYFKVTGDIR
jgi:hypothetical protein